eukprot:TRINITY_DN3879_c0_g1_i5.p3 TRINITY_DN3879_c0_g1~~TRINITY_DN3879_c0_g1_i5.p3  ORF type:complete len:279 (-),score=17.82 TRINITY_DN3879_c0_g1_i5:130-966(-)
MNKPIDGRHLVGKKAIDLSTQVGRPREHTRTHEGLYVCTFPGCSKMYKQHQSLWRHQKAHLTGLNESDCVLSTECTKTIEEAQNEFFCVECAISGISRSGYERHLTRLFNAQKDVIDSTVHTFESRIMAIETRIDRLEKMGGLKPLAIDLPIVDEIHRFRIGLNKMRSELADVNDALKTQIKRVNTVYSIHGKCLSNHLEAIEDIKIRLGECERHVPKPMPMPKPDKDDTLDEFLSNIQIAIDHREEAMKRKEKITKAGQSTVYIENGGIKPLTSLMT